MKKIQYSIIVAVLLALSLAACKNNQAPKTVLINSSEAVVEVAFKSQKNGDEHRRNDVCHRLCCND